MRWNNIFILFIFIFVSFCNFETVKAQNNKFLSIPFSFNPSLIQGWIYNSGKLHKGVDYYCDEDDDLFADFDGYAMQAAQKIDSTYSYGKYVFIKHTNGYASLYAHFSDVSDHIKYYDSSTRHNENYSEWTQVKKGDYLGKCGMTGSDNTHLHFEVTNGHYSTGQVDPYDLYTTSQHYYPNSSGIGVGENSLWESIPPDFVHEKVEETIQPTEPKQSLFQKLKSFFTTLFNQEDTEVTLGDKIEEERDAVHMDAEILNKDIDIYAEPGEVVDISIRAQNAGGSPWQQRDLSINVAGGEYKNRIYKHSSWLTNLRTTALDQTSVNPGAEGSFSFQIRMPDDIGEYEFQAMIVRQQGYNFTWLGDDMFVARLHVGQDEPVDIEDSTDEDSNVINDIGKKVKQGIKGIKESTENVVEDIIEQIKKVPTYFGGGGGSSTPVEEDTTFPEIVVLFPTSTPYMIDTTSTVIFGSYNDDVRHVWVNGAMGDDMAYDNENKLWYYTVELDMTTSTFSFVGWDDDFSHSSSAHDIMMIYEEEEEIILPEMSVTTPSSTPWTVTSTDIMFVGTFNSSTSNILVNNTTTQDMIMNTSTYSWTLPVIVSSTTSTFDFIAMDDLGNLSATTSIAVILDEEGPTMQYITATTTDTGVTWSYMATDTLSNIGDYDISFSVAPDESYNDMFCTGDDVWYETGDISVLSSVDTFFSLLNISPCILFVTTTVDTILPVALDDAHGALVFDMTILATDDVGNAGSASSTTYAWQVVSSGDVVEGDIVLSEIAWMGTQASANDEWFELCNVDDVEININGWHVMWDEQDIVIPAIKLPASSCVVFERTDQTTIDDYDYSILYSGAMGNTGEHVIVYSALGNIMDEVDMSMGWVYGDNETKDSMIRIDPSISGNNADNWCSFATCPQASMRGTQSGVDAAGNSILGSVGNSELLIGAY